MNCHIKRFLLGATIMIAGGSIIIPAVYFERLGAFLALCAVIFLLCTMAYALGSVFVEDPKNKDNNEYDWGSR